MRYKTTIEVVTEADSKYEAADIAGEFLKGNLNTGAELKVRTVSDAKVRRITAFAAICAIAAIFAMVLVYANGSYKIARIEKKSAASYAIQPPLKTGLADVQNSKEFRKIWEKEHKDRINSLAR